jgi:hypothetical protein
MSDSFDLTTALDATLEEASLLVLRDQLLPLARSTVLLGVAPAESLALGTSKLGGVPDLPEGVDWPRTDDGLMAFLGQMDLAALPDAGQPLRDGWLFVFSEQTDGAAGNPHHLLWHRGPRSVLRSAPPPGAFADPDQPKPFRQLEVVRFTPRVSLPGGLDDIDLAAVQNEDDYFDLVRALESDPLQKEPTSRMWGYPSSFHGENVNPDRELLLHVESFFAQGHTYMNFWDAGSISIEIDRAALSREELSQSEALLFSN